ncbi:hepatic lectin-like isoform X2 [Xyrichtys novacula]|uniref:Hepatic lectin-like isoform X2 n=1 Tax=Xyrichtys novacula TaxID=13765 RepID=A0AAV1HCJ3_XYRNO|nr:hepatic lectin-like isoform X2 [Xyrichtys novacula]
MSEADVTYSDVKFTKSRDKDKGKASPSEDTTYSEVKIAKTAPQPPAELTGPQQPAESNKRSCPTSVTAVVVVLLVLLVCAASALGYTTYQNSQTEEQLRSLRVENEELKKNITGRKCEAKPCLIFNQTCPKEHCLKCEEGWERFGEMCYNFSTNKLNWNASRDDCQRRGGDLVKIESREEQIYLDEILRNKMKEPEDKFWIGLTDSVNEGEWLWVDGSPLNERFTFWGQNEPDNLMHDDARGQDCARVGGTGFSKHWFDRSCRSPQKSICEKPVEKAETGL